MVKASRDICIKMADGSQFCKQSPIRDCGCDRNVSFVDPFPEVPVDLTPTRFMADIEQVLKLGMKGLDQDDELEKLRTICVIARLVMCPKNIRQNFIISSLDLPTLVPVPLPPAPGAQ
jgi:hypothetical protein